MLYILLSIKYWRARWGRVRCGALEYFLVSLSIPANRRPGLQEIKVGPVGASILLEWNLAWDWDRVCASEGQQCTGKTGLGL